MNANAQRGLALWLVMATIALLSLISVVLVASLQHGTAVAYQKRDAVQAGNVLEQANAMAQAVAALQADGIELSAITWGAAPQGIFSTGLQEPSLLPAVLDPAVAGAGWGAGSLAYVTAGGQTYRVLVARGLTQGTCAQANNVLFRSAAIPLLSTFDPAQRPAGCFQADATGRFEFYRGLGLLG